MKPGNYADGGKTAHLWPIPNSPGVLCALNFADQGQKRYRKAQSPSLCVNPPLVKLVLHHKATLVSH